MKQLTIEELFTEEEIGAWFTAKLPELEYLEEIAIEFVHELEGEEDTDDEDTPPDHECKSCGVECTLKNGFKWFREDDTYECARCFDKNDEMTQSEYREWNRWNRDPESDDGCGDVDPDKVSYATVDEYIFGRVKDLCSEFDLPYPEFCPVQITNELASALKLSRQVETLEAERAKLIAEIATLKTTGSNSGAAPAATQPIPIPAERK